MSADTNDNREVSDRYESATRDAYFDALASALAGGSISRGRVLRLMGGAILGGMLATISPGMGSRVLAQERLCPMGCPPGQQCCPVLPAGGGAPTDGICVPAGQACTSQGCQMGQVRCNGTCTSLGTNENCAGCGNACNTAAGESCVNGVCGQSCVQPDPVGNPAFCEAPTTCCETELGFSLCCPPNTICRPTIGCRPPV